MGTVFCSYFVDNHLTRLRNAIENSNEKRIRELINKNQNIIDQECDRNGNTPLIFAVQNAKLEACKILLELGANPNKINEQTKITPIHVACTLKTLTSTESEFNVNNNNESSNKNKTLMQEDSQLTKTESQNTNTTTTNNSQSSILTSKTSSNSNIIHSTITDSDTITKIINLLIKHGADINKPIDNDNLFVYGSNIKTTKLTPLMFAIEQRNITAIKALLNSNVDINYQDTESHICAFHLACGIGNLMLVKLLLDNGGNPYLKSRGGNSALHWLALNHKDDMTCLFTILNHTDYIMNVNLQNDNGQTPLMLAAMKSKQNMIKILLDNGASMVFKDNNGQTAMDYTTDQSCINLLNSFKIVEKIALKKLSKSKLSLNISDTRYKLNRSAISLTNVSRSYDSLSVVEEDFTNRVIDEKLTNEELTKNL